MAIRKLTPVVHEKVWGSPLTQPWLENPEGRQVGEIWFSVPEVMPVLVKLLFTTDRLSVQVHPPDAYARAHGEVRGKTEMWHILRAEAGATVALGVREPVTHQHLRTAALNGAIVDLLDWLPARESDTFFVPAGTIHAIGGGLAICEIQQLSDVTYRLFDYLRKPERPLHLDESLAVAHLTKWNASSESKPLAHGRELLAECEYFRTERWQVRGMVEVARTGPAIYVAVQGEGRFGEHAFQPGDAFLATPDAQSFAIRADAATFIVASPAQ